MPENPYPSSAAVHLEELERRIGILESERRDFIAIRESVAVLTERTAGQDVKLTEIKTDTAGAIAKLEKTYGDALVSIRRTIEKDAAATQKAITWLTRTVLGGTGVVTTLAVVIAKLAGVG